MATAETGEVPDPIIAVPDPGIAPSATSKRVALSLCLVLAATGASVAESQLAKQAYTPNFNAPFFMMYTSQFIRLTTLPLYLVFAQLIATAKRKPFSWRGAIRYDTTSNPKEQSTFFSHLLGTVCPFMGLRVQRFLLY